MLWERGSVVSTKRGDAGLNYSANSEISSHLFIQEFKREGGVDDCKCWKVFFPLLRWKVAERECVRWRFEVKEEGEMQIYLWSCDN